ncbi:MAG: hypothetical protein GY760_16995 [Deltaproteobacteria bacterium]|nr:hypothetical protein [Deltaproteobacteria bacterium]
MTNFSTIEKIKLVAKLNDNFSDDSIEHFQNQATATINRYLKQKYEFDSNNLPDNFNESQTQTELQRLEEELTKSKINIHFTKGQQSNRTSESDNTETKQKNTVIEELESIAKGSFPLYDSFGVEYPQKTKSFYRPRGYPIDDTGRAFNENNIY